MQEISSLQDELNEIKNGLSVDQQHYLSLRSIQNFLNAYDKITRHRSEVYRLLVEYFKIIEANGYLIDKDTSTNIGKEYIVRIGFYYGFQAGFKIRFTLQLATMYSIFVDVILFVLLGFKKTQYLLIVPLIIFLYLLYVKLFYERKNKVYGVRY